MSFGFCVLYGMWEIQLLASASEEVESRRGSVTFQRTSSCEPHTGGQISAPSELTAAFPFYCSYDTVQMPHAQCRYSGAPALHTHNRTVALIPGQVWVHNSHITIRSLIPQYLKPQYWAMSIPVMGNGLSSYSLFCLKATSWPSSSRGEGREKMRVEKREERERETGCT